MRLHRFYLEKGSGNEKSGSVANSAGKNKNSVTNLGQENITISSVEILHQITSVFRYKAGDRLAFFDGTGFDYIYEIINLNKRVAEFSFVEKTENKTKKSNIVLAFSLIKNQHDELVIQKCTELGISKFRPIISERTEKKSLNVDRANKIAIEATEQSGRDLVPTIFTPIKLNDLISTVQKSGEKLIAFHMTGEDFTESVVKNIISESVPTNILIGPEGGWSDEEIKLFAAAKIPLYKINNAVLRAETAAIAVSGIIGLWNR